MRRLVLPLQFCILVALTFLYLYPGSVALINGRTDTVMSDDTDPVTLPYAYGALIKTWHEHPMRFFYGAVFTTGADPDRGSANWFPWSERWLVLFYSNFFPVEQLSTAVIFTLLMLNAICMYALARYLNWNRSIASGLAIAWAFCVYTRARAKVHGAMTGTYHLPLIFLALFLVVRGRGRRSLAAAMVCFLLAVTTAHYYIVTSLFLSPLFLLLIAMQPEARAAWRRTTVRLVIAVVPALLFLGFNYLKTIPSDVNMSAAESYPDAGFEDSGKTHPYLNIYAARPIDYLGSDISLNAGATDPNWLRQTINEKIVSSLGEGNAHERSNGIRWSIILLAGAALVFLVMGRFRDDQMIRNNLLFFAIFGLFTFWLSLSPDIPFEGWGPSGWLQAIMHQIRVPSRAGINVHFSLLMISGFLLASKVRWRKILQYPGVFPIIMLIGYPPLVQNMPMSEVRPAYIELQRENGACGTGLFFPFANFYEINVVYYQFIQRLRGSDCKVLNSMSNVSRLALLTRLFPTKMDYLNHLPYEDRSADALEKLAKCVPLAFIAFHPSTPREWVEKLCQRLNWKLNSDLTCVSPDKGTPLTRYPEACL